MTQLKYLIQLKVRDEELHIAGTLRPLRSVHMRHDADIRTLKVDL